MKIKRIHLEHFRCWKDQTIELDNYICFVGANGAGKSAVLCALNIFFRHSQNSPTNILNLHEEDFYQKDTSHPIKITITFDNLNQEAQDDFKLYFRQGELSIHVEARWSEATKSAMGRHFGSRKVMTAFWPFFTAEEENKLVTVLRDIYNTIRESFPDLPKVTTKDAMRCALRDYEEAHPAQCELSPSENQFYGWSKGTNLLEKYIQWVYVPALKDATGEQDENKNSAFGQLLERTIRQSVNFAPKLEELKSDLGVKYKELLDQNRGALADVSNRLETRLRTWSSPRSALRLDWQYDEQKSVQITSPTAHVQAGEDDFIGEVSRLGHGLQRSYLVAFLQELAEQKGHETGPTLILGFEEPELYQHPPQAKYLRTVLEGLAAGGSQILITTHSPHLVSSQGFTTLRRVTKQRTGLPQSKIGHATVEQISASLAAALGREPAPRSAILAAIEQIMEPSLSELYFCDVAILVEGAEDVAYLTSHLVLTNQVEKFRRYGCHFIVCRGKTNMSRPLAIANALGIPAFTIFDSDSNHMGTELVATKRDNACLLCLSGVIGQEATPTTLFISEKLAMLSPNMTQGVKSERDEQEWTQIQERVKISCGLGEGVKGKNAYFIAHILETIYREKGPSSILEKVVSAFLHFAETKHTKVD